MWTYEQLTGRLLNDAGEVVAIGYSGNGEGKNNPHMESVHDAGPIPCGVYDIESPRDTTTHGPFVMPLNQEISNTMYGRAGFLIHGDSVHAPGTASQGCIILARDIRQKIWESGDRSITVVSGLSSWPR